MLIVIDTDMAALPGSCYKCPFYQCARRDQGEAERRYCYALPVNQGRNGTMTARRILGVPVTRMRAEWCPLTIVANSEVKGILGVYPRLMIVDEW